MLTTYYKISFEDDGSHDNLLTWYVFSEDGDRVRTMPD